MASERCLAPDPPGSPWGLAAQRRRTSEPIAGYVRDLPPRVSCDRRNRKKRRRRRARWTAVLAAFVTGFSSLALRGRRVHAPDCCFSTRPFRLRIRALRLGRRRRCINCLSPMGRIPIEDWVDRNDAVRINAGVAVVVVPDNVIELHGAGDAGPLIEFARVGP